MTWRGIFTGALALIALEAVVRTNESAGRVGELLEGVGNLVRKAMSPTVAAIPDTRVFGDTTFGKTLDDPLNPLD